MLAQQVVYHLAASPAPGLIFKCTPSLYHGEKSFQCSIILSGSKEGRKEGGKREGRRETLGRETEALQLLIAQHGGMGWILMALCGQGTLGLVQCQGRWLR